MKLPKRPLLLITDRRQAVLPLAEVVTAALEGGCRWISFREKDLPLSEQVALAENLLPAVRRFAARLTLHGDVEAGEHFDGVHLAEGGDVRAARRRLGSEKLLGLSVHTPRQAALADPTLLDYVIAGPVYESTSKPGYGPALGSAGIADFVHATTLPIIAIGGVIGAHIPELIEAGVAGVAVMGSVMRASDPARVVGALIAALKAAK